MKAREHSYTQNGMIRTRKKVNKIARDVVLVFLFLSFFLLFWQWHVWISLFTFWHGSPGSGREINIKFWADVMGQCDRVTISTEPMRVSVQKWRGLAGHCVKIGLFWPISLMIGPEPRHDGSKYTNVRGWA